ncbi:hypothetical protein COCCADRAFT_41818 [Bipolaris zeicola 26-R-13]|uniref:Uncharacterized protein n=1 Tax=Cochliobolus carbonum (strain 26-R-13) TaxID=930089 RepID=W6XPK1_COCC2|nr:uncharacterized protein COCCADRAFT_41818 [Bipolaris zeicola 26-R-13]EUC27463.1 hypothetical protein COCCADRAFT_41818 [Bipolaris zeicola 26-R-13]
MTEGNQGSNVQSDEAISEQLVAVKERWYYPSDIEKDMKDVDIPFRAKEAVFATAWEYTRCVIPEYTNWSRYVAFMRIMIIGIIAEFRGSLIDVINDDTLLGYSLTKVLNTLSQVTNQIVIMLFRNYNNALSKSPWQFFRMRDTETLVRFTIGAALACNDLDHVWFTNEQFDILAEIGNTMYDGAAHCKHCLDGEVSSTFTHISKTKRMVAFHKCREALWALDVAWAGKPNMKCVINFLRYFGGPIHMTMRQYRLIEGGLAPGKPGKTDSKELELQSLEQYHGILARETLLLFNGLRAMLEEADQFFCSECNYRAIYGAPQDHVFGKCFLCAGCQQEWAVYTEILLERMVKSFPEAAEIIRISEMRATSSALL